MRRHSLYGLLILSMLSSVFCASPPAAPPTSGPPPSPPPQKEEAKATSPSKLERVKLQNASTGSSYLAFYLGKEKGLYQKEGIDLEIMVIKAPLAMPSLMANEVDYSSMGTTTFQAALKGLPVKVVMGMMKLSWHLIGGPGINSPRDLVGKTLGVSSIGAAASYATEKGLEHLGINPKKDVTFVVIPPAEQLAALKSRAIAMAAMLGPFDVMAREEGFKELLATGEVLELPSDSIGTTEKRLKENPGQVKRMIKATLTSMAYARNNPQEAMDFLIKEFGLTPKLATPTYQEQMNNWNFDGTITDKGFQIWLEMGKATGVLTGDPRPEKAVDFTLLNEVKKELGLSR